MTWAVKPARCRATARPRSRSWASRIRPPPRPEAAGKRRVALAQPDAQRPQDGDFAADLPDLGLHGQASGPQAKRRPVGRAGPLGQRGKHQLPRPADHADGRAQARAAVVVDLDRAGGQHQPAVDGPGAAAAGPVLAVQPQPQAVADAVDLDLFGAALRPGVVTVAGLRLVPGAHGGRVEQVLAGRPHPQPPDRGGHEGLREPKGLARGGAAGGVAARGLVGRGHHACSPSASVAPAGWSARMRTRSRSTLAARGIGPGWTLVWRICQPSPACPTAARIWPPSQPRSRFLSRSTSSTTAIRRGTSGVWSGVPWAWGLAVRWRSHHAKRHRSRSQVSTALDGLSPSWTARRTAPATWAARRSTRSVSSPRSINFCCIGNLRFLVQASGAAATAPEAPSSDR